LTAAFNAFAIVNPTAPQVTGSLPTPYFYFDPTTQLINLVVSSAWATTGGTQALIVINSSALSFLSSFDFLSLSGDQFAFVIQNNGNNGYALYGTSPTNPPSFLKFTQEYDSMSNWISLRKIILSTNAMPVISEAVPAYSATGEQTGVYNSFPILTDFIPEINSAADSRGIAYYTPTSQYRLIDLTNNQPLSKIDLKIYWEDKLGNLYDLYIPQYQQATVKIAFVRKSLYKQSPLLYK
jgi:hypothetical protein